MGTSRQAVTEADTDHAGRDKLVADLKVVVADAEELLKASANQTGERITAARAKAEESLKVAKVRLADAQASAMASTKAAAKATDDYVHENPWRAVGVAGVAGLLLGALISRR